MGTDDNSRTWTMGEWPDQQGTSAGELPDRYTDLALLGEGGMGIVRRAHDRVLSRDVALKCLRPQLYHLPQAVERFRAEAQTIAALQHPGVIPIFDQGALPDGRPYYAMQLVQGDTLALGIRQTHESGRRRLVATVLDVARTVAYAHQVGVVHRDLKPHNVLMGLHGEVFVVDWGLSKGMSGELHGDRTVAGRSLGTPRYMSPEAARGDLDSIGPPADVYGLALILFEALVGRPARERSTRESLEHDVQDTPRRVGSASIPDGLRDLVESAVHPDPSERPSASSFAAQLGDWLAGVRRREAAHALLDEALATEADRVMEHLAPRERGPSPGSTGPLILPYDYGRFRVDVLVREQRLSGDLAVTMIPFDAACAYAEWKAERSGLPWRLPTVDEWEKAARGVDGRKLPWGSRIDGAFAAIRASHSGPILRTAVGQHEADRSVYGVVDTAGGVSEWVDGGPQSNGASTRV